MKNKILKKSINAFFVLGLCTLMGGTSYAWDGKKDGTGTHALIAEHGLTMLNNDLNKNEPQPVKQKIEIETEEDIPIVSDVFITVDDAKKWAQGKGATKEFVELADLYWEYSDDYSKKISKLNKEKDKLNEELEKITKYDMNNLLFLEEIKKYDK